MPISPVDATSILGAENKAVSYTGPATEYLALFTVAPRLVTVSLSSSTAIIGTFISTDDQTNVTCRGVPAGTKMTYVDATHATLSQAATITGSAIALLGGVEVTGGGYARAAVTWGAAVDGTVSNSAAINFTGMPSCVVIGHGLFDALTNGSLRQSNTIASITVASGNTVQYAIGALTSTVS